MMSAGRTDPGVVALVVPVACGRLQVGSVKIHGSQDDIASGFEPGWRRRFVRYRELRCGSTALPPLATRLVTSEAGTIGMNGELIGCFIVAGCGECRVHDQLTVRAPTRRSGYLPPGRTRPRLGTSLSLQLVALPFLGEGNSFGDDRWLTEA